MLDQSYSSLPNFIIDNPYKPTNFLQETPKKDISMTTDTKFVLHLKCDGRGHKTGILTHLNGVTRKFDLGPNTYSSGYWDIKLEEGKKLIGGELFLHETKNKTSTLGGEVIDVYEQELTEENIVELEMDFLPIPSRRTRIVIVFQLTSVCKNIEWRGDKSFMSHNGKIHEVSVKWGKVYMVVQKKKN